MLAIVLSLTALPAYSSHLEGLGDAFTYQGRLIDSEAAADGLYDFSFTLYPAQGEGDPLGESPVELTGVEVIDGYFTVELDFGEVFDGRQ